MSKPIVLWGPTAAGTAAATVFTNITGKAAILDSVVMANPSTGAATSIRLSIGTDGATTRVIDFSIPAGVGTYTIYPGIITTGTTILQLSSTSTNNVVIVCGNGREMAV